MEDHQQQPAGTGEQAFNIKAKTAADIAVDLTPKAMGYFRANLAIARADGKGAKRTFQFSFARIRPERPQFRDLEGKPGTDGELIWATVLGLRGLRQTPSLTDVWIGFHNDKGEIDWEKWAKARESYVKLRRESTVRTVVNLMSGSPSERDLEEWFKQKYGGTPKAPAMGDGGLTGGPTADEGALDELGEDDAGGGKDKKDKKPAKKDWREILDEAKLRWLGEWAKHVKEVDGIDAWEPTNEPDLGMGPKDYAERLLKVQYPVVKKGNPAANFLGGSCCGLEKQGWVRTLYQEGAGKLFDGIRTISVSTNDNVTRRSIDTRYMCKPISNALNRAIILEHLYAKLRCLLKSIIC